MLKFQLPWQCFVLQTRKVWLAHLYPKAIMYPIFYFNCLKIVEVVRSTRFGQKICRYYDSACSGTNTKGDAQLQL